MINIISLTEKSLKFIEKAKLIHGDRYDYSLVEYVKATNNISINCYKHGMFNQTPNIHLSRKAGCPKCAGLGKDTNQFIEESRLIHGNKYDYSISYYQGPKNKVDIICDNHGLFSQQPNSHLRGQGCPKCKSSKGENIIRNFLKENNINFKEQYKFSGCVFKNPLLFDFYLPDLNICIEFQGEQHYKKNNYFGGLKEFKKLKIRDKIKKDYCLNNNIQLIEFNKNNINELQTIIGFYKRKC